MLMKADPFTDPSLKTDYYQLAEFDGGVIDQLRTFRRVGSD